MGWSLRTMLSRFDRRPVDPEERSPQLGLKYKDLMLLEAIQKQGGDLFAPRHVLHYLYFASSDAAMTARADLEAAGWQAQARDPLPEYPGQWGVVAEQRDVVLDPDFVRSATDLMEAVAARGDGEYDGWEASA